MSRVVSCSNVFHTNSYYQIDIDSDIVVDEMWVELYSDNTLVRSFPVANGQITISDTSITQVGKYRVYVKGRDAMGNNLTFNTDIADFIFLS